VARLGDDHPHVGVKDVARQVLAPAGVVEADHGRAREARPAEGEEVVGRVVEQHGDMERPPLDPAGEEELCPAARLGQVVGVGPHLIVEAHRRAASDVGVGRVAPQERRRVRRRQRRLAGRRDART